MKKRIDNLTKELQDLRSLLSKNNNKRQNPYKWNRYYNHENRVKNPKNQTKPDEEKVIEKNCQRDLENMKLLQQKSHCHQKIHESSKSNKIQPMEIDKSLHRKSSKSKKVDSMEIDKCSTIANAGEIGKPSSVFVKPASEKKLNDEQIISILKTEKQKTKKLQSSNCVQPKMEALRRQKTEFEAKVKTIDETSEVDSERSSENTSKIFLQRTNDDEVLNVMIGKPAKG